MKLASKVTLVVVPSLVIALAVKIAISPSKLEHAVETKAKSDISWLTRNVEEFKSDKGSYPNNLEELVPEYVEKIPKDPWGERYRLYSDETYFMVFTLNQNKLNELIYRKYE